MRNYEADHRTHIASWKDFNSLTSMIPTSLSSNEQDTDNIENPNLQEDFMTGCCDEQTVKQYLLLNGYLILWRCLKSSGMVHMF